jgi:integrase
MKREWQPDRKISGLGLMVLPTGVRTYYVRYREPSGKQQTHKIGRAEVVSLTMAREEAIKILAAVAKGEAPGTDKQLLRQGKTIRELSEMVTEKHYATRVRPSTKTGYAVLWKNHILPRIGAEKVATLQTIQVIDMLEELPRGQQNRALAVLRKAINLAELWGIRAKGTNPCKGIQVNGERKIKRYLSRAELERLLAALDAFAEAGVRWRFAQLIRLLLLTGCRVREIMTARWEWLDQDATILTLPPDAHKTGGQDDERKVHLPPAASLILRELRRRSNTEWIIAGDGDGHLIGYWYLWDKLLEAAKIKNLRVHDLRHSYASYAITTAGLTLPQVGALLGHASPQTTARYAHLMDEAAAAMAAKVASAITQQKAPAV